MGRKRRRRSQRGQQYFHDRGERGRIVVIIPGRAFIISFFDAFKLVDFKRIIAKSTINNTD